MSSPIIGPKCTVIDGRSSDAEAIIASAVEANRPILILRATTTWPIQQALTQLPPPALEPNGWPSTATSSAWLNAAAAAASSAASPSIDLAALQRLFGDRTAAIEAREASEYGVAARSTCTVREYVASWRTAHEGLQDDDDGALVAALGYLKDFHLHLGGERGGCEAGALAYSVPVAFRDDWLNAWADDVGQDDFKFLYLGPRGSSTAVHHDVICSCSWSAQLSGSKRWRMRPSAVAGEWTTIVQPPGSLLFVPSGYYHEVLNITPSLSVNHNWFGPASARRSWEFLQCEAEATVAEFAEFKEAMDREGAGIWEQRVIDVERINSGLSRRQFAELLLVQIRSGRQSSKSSAEEARSILRELCDEAAPHGAFLGEALLLRARAALDNTSTPPQVRWTSRVGRDIQRFGDNGNTRLVAGCVPIRLVKRVARGGSGDGGEVSRGDIASLIEVMLISGRSDRKGKERKELSLKASRWIYPKGGWDEDETVGEAALREAREEAGVRGRLVLGDEGQLSPIPLLLHTVRYTVDPAKLAKKHTETLVAIYVLRVESVESSDKWAEGQSRSRRWLPLSEARAMLAAQVEGGYVDKYETVETMDKIATWANSATAAEVEWLGECDAKSLDLEKSEEERYISSTYSSSSSC